MKQAVKKFLIMAALVASVFTTQAAQTFYCGGSGYGDVDDGNPDRTHYIQTQNVVYGVDYEYGVMEEFGWNGSAWSYIGVRWFNSSGLAHFTTSNVGYGNGAWRKFIMRDGQGNLIGTIYSLQSGGVGSARRYEDSLGNALCP